MKARWGKFQTSRFKVFNNPSRPRNAPDCWCWNFSWSKDGWKISNSGRDFPTREAALADAKAHGIEWEE